MREEFKRGARRALAVGALAGLAAVGGREVGKRQERDVTQAEQRGQLEGELDDLNEKA